MDFFQFAGYAENFVKITINDNKYWICLLVGALCFLVVYIFQVFGLLSIARREGYQRRWMIFVPILNTYYIGVCSQKNKVYGLKASTFAIITAVLEGVLVVGYILYYIAIFLCWDYIDWLPYYDYYYYVGGFTNMPSSLTWLGWMLQYGNSYILEWIELVFIVAKMLLLTAFFRTYSSPRYLLFSIFGALLPLTGIFIYVVRNNTGMRYEDYIRRVRERNYRMYQQQHGNPYNQNPYNNNPYNNPYNQNPYGQNAQGSANAPDPFEGYGSSSSSGNNSSNSNESPFDDFN